MTNRRFGTVRKLPSGRYQARYSDPSGRRYSAPVTFARKGDANAWLASVQTDLHRGEMIDPSLHRVPFGEWASEWQRTTVDLRLSTRARDETYLRTAILPWFESTPIADIDHLAVRGWIADLISSGRAPATVAKAKQIMGKVMKTAVASNAIRTNPCSDVPLPRIEREEMRFLAPAEVGELADAIDRRYAALVWLGAYGGLRAGELFALRARHIHPLHRTVDVVETLVEVRGVHHFGPPKTKAARRKVPLPALVVDRLTEHLAHFDLCPDMLAFAAPGGGPVRLSLWRRRFWYPAVREAGLAPLRIHDLRHTAVAMWIAAGLSPVGIAKRAGHTSVVTVQDRYGHLLPGGEDVADAALEAIARTAGATDRRRVPQLQRK